jgi:nicotinamide N-methyltransferase
VGKRCCRVDVGSASCAFLEVKLTIFIQRSLSISGYSAIILSDLLHFHASHPALLSSLTQLLSSTREARAYVGAGKYTPEHVCSEWLECGEKAGLEWEEINLLADNGWTGAMEVVWSGTVMTKEDLSVRKEMCRLWVGKWSEFALQTSA